MKVFRNIIVSVVMTMSMAAISSNVSAAEQKDLNAVVREAAEGTIAKIEEAIGLVEQGTNSEAAVASINDARQLQKEFRYEQTERLRQRANDKLRLAREALQSDNKQSADVILKEALAVFQDMKSTYDAAH